MKRAWPYALALAVVVTGCYLALVPLLRSLSPAPTASATSQLVQGTATTRVDKQNAKTDVLFNSKRPKTKSTFVSALAPKTKAKKKAKKAKTPAVNNFATNPTSTSTTPRTVVKPPKKPATTPTSTTKAAASKPKGASAVGGGSVDQTQVGGGGLATGGGDSGSSDFGQTSAVGP